MLRVEHLTKRFADLPVFEDLSFDVGEGEFVCVLGPSGCGKSTLISCIAGLEIPTSGTIKVYGESVEAPSIDRGMIFQEYALFPWMTVVENIEFGLKMKGIQDYTERRRIANEAIGQVNLQNFADYYPYQLSGGMKQRVAIARSLVVQPSLLLMDEPFGALDALTRQVLQDEVVRIWQRTRMTVLFVTHSIQEAVFLGDRVLCLSRQPSRIKKEFSVKAARPRNVETPSQALASTIEDIKSALFEEVDGLRAYLKVEETAHG